MSTAVKCLHFIEIFIIQAADKPVDVTPWQGRASELDKHDELLFL